VELGDGGKEAELYVLIGEGWSTNVQTQQGGVCKWAMAFNNNNNNNNNNQTFIMRLGNAMQTQRRRSLHQ